MKLKPFVIVIPALILSFLLQATPPTSAQVGPNIEILTGIPAIPANGETHELVAIALVGSDGKPIAMDRDITVQLSSSRLDVATVASPLVIPAGSTYGIAKITTTSNPGFTNITASVSNVVSKVKLVKTAAVRGVSTKIAITAAPTKLPADPKMAGTIAVQIQDDYGKPVRATNDLLVTLESTDPSLITVTPTLIIRVGEDHAIGIYRPTTKPGTNAIIATTPGLGSATIFLTTNSPLSVAWPPPRIVIQSLLPSVLVDGKTRVPIAVQVQTLQGVPALTTVKIPVSLSLADTSIGSVTGLAVIDEGESFGIALFNTTQREGTTGIRASVGDQITASAQQKTSVTGAKNIRLHSVPNTLWANSKNYTSLYVELVDSDGNPARVTREVLVVMSSSSIAIGRVEGRLLIPLGRTYASASLSTSFTPGNTTVTAHTDDFESGRVNMRTIVFPTNLTLSTPIPRARVGDDVRITVFLTSKGEPLPGASVTWSASSGKLADLTTTGRDGSTSNVFSPIDSGTARIVVTARKEGYAMPRLNMTFNIPPRPITLTVTANPRSIEVGQVSEIIATVRSEGRSLPDANMTWQTTAGSFARRTPNSDAEGRSVAVLTSNVPANVTVTALVSKRGYIPANATVALTIRTVSSIQPPDGTQDKGQKPLLGGSELMFIVPGAAIVAGSLLFLVRRRRKRKGIVFEGEEEGTAEEPEGGTVAEAFPGEIRASVRCSLRAGL